MHYTLQPARALIARRITISFFLVVSKQSGVRHALPPQSPAQPDGGQASGRQQGAIFTQIIALNWGLFGYNPTEALWTDTRCRPVGDLHSTRDLCQGSFSVSCQAPWHLWGLGSLSARPASWASEVETQEVCQPLGAICFLQPCSYSMYMVCFFI